MIYPGIGELVAKILERDKHIYLCTNGMFIKKGCTSSSPSRFFFNVHLDGMEKNHDIAVEREGVFDAAIDGIKAAKEAGFLVCTNTTVYKETDMDEIDELFAYLERSASTVMISPAYGYSAVNDREIFMTRDDIRDKFRDADGIAKSTAFNQSPIYLEFLQGKRELTCTAWGNPTRNVKGWKGPCYLITDIHHKTFDDLMNKTPWEKYGLRQGPALRELHGPLRLRAICGFRN